MNGPDVISVCVVRSTREDVLEVTLRYSYEGKPPSSRKRAEMARALLVEALARLENGKPMDLGFSEDATRRVRTDRMQA